MAQENPDNNNNDTIFEEKESLMISPNGRIPTLRKAHFLKPLQNPASINGRFLKLPSLPLCSESEWPIQVYFNGFPYNPLTNWPKWVFSLKPKYEFIWKKSGIYEALMASTYQIRRNTEVIFAVAERWCSETSSFLFPWGEATVTLEDMMVLGGFSVLGSPCSMPLEYEELKEIERDLEKVRVLIIKSKALKGDQFEWLDFFMKSGNQEMEHEAFLALWLSRYVFPGTVFDSINRDVFSIAIYLARGVKIALAPSVLATLYRDLSLLKETVLAAASLKVNKCKKNYLALTLWSPLQYVQIWAWERLPALRPKPKLLQAWEPRMARWHGVNRWKRENFRWIIDSAVDSFLWRPYAICVENWSFPEFYKEEEEWVDCGYGLTEELESFARCLRVSELVWINSVEPYLPHRVAMQFGMDQDLPKWISRPNVCQEVAWEHYSRSIGDARLYFPPRLFEADVTTRYLEWWEKSVLDPQSKITDMTKGKRSSRKRSNADLTLTLPAKCKKPSIQGRRKASKKSFRAVKKHRLLSLPEDNKADCPPAAPPKCDWKDERVQACIRRKIQDIWDADVRPVLTGEERCISSSTKGNDDAPPAFVPKCNSVKELDQTCNKGMIKARVVDNEYNVLAFENHCLPSSSVSHDADTPDFYPPSHWGTEMDQTCNKRRTLERSDVDVKAFPSAKKHSFSSTAKVNNTNAPPGFTPKCNKGKMQDRWIHDQVGAYPPGFSPKCDLLKEILPTFNTRNIQDGADVDVKPFLAAKERYFSSSNEGDNAGAPPGFTPRCNKVRLEERVVDHGVSGTKVMMNRHNENSARRSATDGEIAGSHGIKPEISVQTPVGGIKHDKDGSSPLTNKPPDLDFEARISMLERLIAELKAERSECRSVKQEPE